MTADSEEWVGPVVDGGDPRPVRHRTEQFAGRVWSIVTDEVQFEHATATRDIQLHPGAVAVIALDEDERVLLIRQYRHPVGTYLFEPPAGLLDEPDEEPWRTAARELGEEAGFTASHWHVLLDVYLSPGGSSEGIRIYLARGLTALPDGREHTGEAEEAHLPRAWVPLDEARDLVLSGRIGSPTAVAGILAAVVAKADGWSSLRPADAPWPAREALLKSERVFDRRHGA
jgi:8-oxo-dGTP pyrophosphatase MutT (NUDIX family)